MAMNLRLPDELAERLRTLADETGRSQQVLVRAAVEQYLDHQELKHLNPWLRAHAKPPVGNHRPLPDSQQIERAPKLGLSDLLRLGRDAQ
ncbi:MAG: ribbon-helix-helix protein, CopG family [Candidatus Nanopelagicales bacterium]|nr:ribbon-helix-helix protein, CopG family [Candidatus Nanopelagicales bacterium]